MFDYSFHLYSFIYSLYVDWVPTMCQDKSPDNSFQNSLIIASHFLTWVLSTIWPSHMYSKEINIQDGLRVPPTLKFWVKTIRHQGCCFVLIFNNMDYDNFKNILLWMLVPWIMLIPLLYWEPIMYNITSKFKI